ncbi:MAG TPA: tetraacyldisaccharide 4'-kinase, partial [Steroidobacteraceae bacterium]
MQRWLNRVWYEGAPGALLLLPLAWLFALGAGLRRAAFRHGLATSQHVGGRVIVVGNLTAGGTGKTPLVIWLVEQLRGRGLNVGVVLRGYGGAAGAARLLASDATAAQVGDEALLIRRRTGCAVAVGRDRVAAARLLRGAGIDYIVSDDGLQHYRLARDAEIVVIDAARGFGNGRLLPAGPLREAPVRLRTVSAVVVNGGASALYEHGIGMQLLPEHIVPLAEYA